MRLSRTPLTILSAALLAASTEAGVEVVMNSKIDIPGMQLKIMGKDFSQSEQRFLVDDKATLKGTVTGESTNWIDLEREAFFDQGKRGCTVTTFAEMEARLKSMQGQGAPFGFTGDDDRPERDPQEYELRFDSQAGESATVAGLTGKSSLMKIEIVEKASGAVVSTIDVDNVYVDSAELKLLQEFDRKMAERQVQSFGAAMGMDFNAMRGKIMGHPDMRMALERMQEAGIGEGQAVVRTVTRITTTAQAMQVDKQVAADDASEEPQEKPKGFAGRMMAKMKGRQGGTPSTEATTSAESGPQSMSFSSELQSFEHGVSVALPQLCVDAYEKTK